MRKGIHSSIDILGRRVRFIEHEKGILAQGTVKTEIVHVYLHDTGSIKAI